MGVGTRRMGLGATEDNRSGVMEKNDTVGKGAILGQGRSQQVFPSFSERDNSSLNEEENKFEKQEVLDGAQCEMTRENVAVNIKHHSCKMSEYMLTEDMVVSCPSKEVA